MELQVAYICNCQRKSYYQYLHADSSRWRSWSRQPYKTYMFLNLVKQEQTHHYSLPTEREGLQKNQWNGRSMGYAHTKLLTTHSVVRLLGLREVCSSFNFYLPLDLFS
jgi:hypothetical protein